MGRQSLPTYQVLRTKLLYELLVQHSPYSQYQLDKLFIDPKYVKPLDGRRRIFNRMKMGHMPYRAEDREVFLDRISNHRAEQCSNGISRNIFPIAVNIYRSLFWELLSLEYSEESNQALLRKVVAALDIEIGLLDRGNQRNVTETGSSKIQIEDLDISVDGSESAYGAYVNLLDVLIGWDIKSLNVLTFLGCLSRNALAHLGHDVAKHLYFKYMVTLLRFCAEFKISNELSEMLNEISIKEVLTIAPNKNSTLTGNLGKDMKMEKSKVLNAFLHLHSSIKTDNFKK